MHRAVAFSALLALVAAGAAFSADQTWGSVKSRLTLESTSIDVGTVRAGKDAVATFTLSNPTSREIRILAAHPS
jgi:hypothetical protein